MSNLSGFDELMALAHVDELRMLASRRAQARSRQEQADARRALADLGRKLFASGGLGLMAATYDAVAERHGYPAVAGVSAAWTGIDEWSA